MRSGLRILVTLPIALAACAPGGPPAPPALEYSVPDPSAATYVRGDTSTMDIDANGQTFEMRMSASGTFGTTFGRAADGVRVAMAVRKFSGTLREPMQEPTTVDETSIDGPLVFTLDRRGAAALVSSPNVSSPADRLFQPLSYADFFFPHLPGSPARAGTSWTDTIRFEGPAAGGDARETRVVTYTVAGDTTVDGRRLLRIVEQGTSKRSATGTAATMEADFSQRLQGDVRGWVLWDPERRLMVERYVWSEGRGTMDVSIAPGPLDIHLRQVSHMKLAEGM